MFIVRSPPLSLKLLATTVSLTVVTYASSSSLRQSLAADLLSVLAQPWATACVPTEKASCLGCCLRFLSPVLQPVAFREPWKVSWEGQDAAEEDAKVMWPSAPIMELARLAVRSGAGRRAIHRALDPTKLPVPDVEGLNKNKCLLTRTLYGRRFANKEINSYFAFLFELIVARGPSVGLDVSLSRYDLFHGHLFLASGSGRLGILFHAKEYPKFDEELFPIRLGFCQEGSNVPCDDSFNLRNILWLAPLLSKKTKACLAPGVLVVLDAHPGGIIYQDMISEDVQVARTIDESDFGELAGDVNYLNVANSAPCNRIFFCCHPCYTTLDH